MQIRADLLNSEFECIMLNEAVNVLLNVMETGLGVQEVKSAAAAGSQPADSRV